MRKAKDDPFHVVGHTVVGKDDRAVRGKTRHSIYVNNHPLFAFRTLPLTRAAAQAVCNLLNATPRVREWGQTVQFPAGDA